MYGGASHVLVLTSNAITKAIRRLRVRLMRGGSCKPHAMRRLLAQSLLAANDAPGATRGRSRCGERFLRGRDPVVVRRARILLAAVDGAPAARRRLRRRRVFLRR